MFKQKTAETSAERVFSGISAATEQHFQFTQFETLVHIGRRRQPGDTTAPLEVVLRFQTEVHGLAVSK